MHMHVLRAYAKRSNLLTLAEHRETLFARVGLLTAPAATLAQTTLEALIEDFPPSFHQ